MRARGGLAVLLVVALTHKASADEDPLESPYEVPKPVPVSPPPELHLELAGSTSFLSAPIRGGTTPFGAGLGAHVGVSIPNFYIGARLHYFLGGTDIDVTNHALVYGAELGYGIRLGAVSNVKFTLRPTLGVGGLRVFHTDPSTTANLKPDVVTSASGQSSSSRRSDTTTVDNVYIEPSVQLLIQSGRLFVSLGPSMMVIPGIAYGGDSSMTWITYGATGSFGARF